MGSRTRSSPSRWITLLEITASSSTSIHARRCFPSPAPPGAKHTPPTSLCAFNSYVRCIVQFFKQATVQSRGQTYTMVKRLEQAAQTSGENKGLGDAVNTGSHKMSVYYAVPITTSIWRRRRCLTHGKCFSLIPPGYQRTAA
jgi:hypothetical protein